MTIHFDDTLLTLSRKLTQAGITHSQLSIASEENNLGITDHQYVWIKLTRPSASTIGLLNEVTFTTAHPDLNPLKLHPSLSLLPIPSGQLASIWQYEPAIQPGDLTNQLESATHAIQHIQTLPTTLPLKTYTPTAYLDRIKYRYRYVQQHHPEVYPQTVLDTLSSLITQIMVEPVYDPQTPLVLNHGDAHKANYVTVNNEPHWIDFESVWYAPKEWDPATIATSLTPEQWESFKNHYGPLDEKILHTLRLTKTLASTTWLLLYPDAAETVNKRITHIQKALKAGYFTEATPQHTRDTTSKHTNP